MLSVKDIADSIKLLGDLVKNTREIMKAVTDGRAYLKRYYPDAQGVLRELLEQMQRAIEGLVNVTQVFSSFRFVTLGDSIDPKTASRDLANLIKHLMAQRGEISKLKGQLRTLKADCDRVRELRDDLDARSKSKRWGSMFELLGLKSTKQAQKMASALSQFYADDQRMLEMLKRNLKLAEKALAEVESSLGPPGKANAYNVPTAAGVLGAYATLFQQAHGDLESLADGMHDAWKALA